MLQGARVAVVVPAYNEARLIDRTLRSVPSYVDHVVVVDDASTDATVARARATDDPRVDVVRHGENRGVGAAIATGYRLAFAAGAHAAAVMAGDGQMDPRDLRSILEPVIRGEADYAKGDRLSHPEARACMPVTRWLGNHALTHMTRLATGAPVRDSQCGYTALARDAWIRLGLDDLWPRYGYPNDLLSRAAVARLRVTDVIVRPVYGEEQSGIRPTHLVTAFPAVLALALLRRARASVRRRRAPEAARPVASEDRGPAASRPEAAAPPLA